MIFFTERDKKRLHEDGILFNNHVVLFGLTEAQIYSLCRKIGVLQKAKCHDSLIFSGNLSSKISENEQVQTLISQISSQLDELHNYGVSNEQIRIMLSPYKKISRLEITDDNRILLIDYSNIEVHMYPIQKAIYILFLNHPEGIVLKNISDYRDELLMVYGKISRSNNTTRIYKTIDKLCDPLSNSLNEYISIINKAFTSVFDELLAKYYIIYGMQGSIYRVSICSEEDIFY